MHSEKSRRGRSSKTPKREKRSFVEILEDRWMLSAGEWLARFDGIPSDTRDVQLPYIQNLFHRAGLDALGVRAEELVGVNGVVIVQANPAADLGAIQKDLQLVPGFSSVEPWDAGASAGTRQIYVPDSPLAEHDGASQISSFSGSITSNSSTQAAAASSLVQTSNGFDGINRTQTSAVSPPDTNGAAGPSSFIETVNLSLAIYDKTTGLTTPGGGITSFGTFFSPLGGTLSFSDPVVVYNEITQRFAVNVLDFSVNASGKTTAMRDDFAISKTNNPSLSSSDWNFFRYNTDDTPGPAVDFSDFPKVGYNADGYVISFNMFPSSFNHVSVLGIGNDGTSTGMRTMPGGTTNFTLAPASMHGAAPGAPMWFLGDGHTGGGGNTINVVRLDNPFSTAAVNSTSFTENVASFLSAPNPRQPGGSLGANTSLGTRFYFSGLRSVGGVTHLVSAHAVGNGTGVESRWYDFNVTTGTPTLIQQGTVNPNTSTTDTYFPDVDIAPDGSIGMNYSESGTSEYMSMYITGRKATDPTSTMQTPVLAKTNPVALDALGRAGDYSFTSIDPTDGTFWAANEYAGSFGSPNWATWIQHFTVGASTVTNRQLFYANSAYDGFSGNPATAHDEAIAPDKVALLPSQGESTFANVSSYTAGINGIMVDLSAGGNHSALVANAATDFVFKVSGPFASNTPSTWTTLSGANLPSVLVRPAGSTTIGGVLANDRIELLWANNKIVGTFLEVIVKANADSGLAADDVFYFGSSPGDSGLGNDPDASFVDATDEIAARNHQESDLSLHHPYSVALSNPYDYNKDDQVDATDQILARNFGNTNGELDYISIPGAGPFAPAAGDGGASAAVASALVFRSGSFASTQSMPTWLPDSLGIESLDAMTIAKYINDLAWEQASRRHAIPTARSPDLSGLSDVLLDSLLSDLGLG